MTNENPISFDQFELSPALQRAIKDMGFETASPIQAQALPMLLEEPTDFIGLAATGTGKTAAFSIPLLERIKPGAKGIQAIVLCPTRELCLQVTEQINLLGKFLGHRAIPIYGGAGYEQQFRDLKRGPAIVVGTPGRMIDHLERGSLKLDDIKQVILDEADEMISMGFREAMETIMLSVPDDQSNIWLFSATMSPAVRRVADEFLKEPKSIQVNRKEMLSSTVEQIYYRTHEANKPEVLCKLIDAAEDFYGVVFCQTKSLVVDLTRYLTERGYRADSLQGDMSQAARETAMKAFRDRRVKVLVCTDVAARGLDVKDVTHVINYSLPRELDNYVHRIGRTARSGKSGLALSLVTPANFGLVRRIENLTKSKFKEGVIPSRKEIGLKKIGAMLTPFSEQKNLDRVTEVLNEEWKTALESMTAEEVAARFLSMQFPWVFSEKERPQMAKSHQNQAGQDSRERGRDRDRNRGGRSYGGDRDGGRSYGRDGGDAGRRSYGRDGGDAGRRSYGRDGGGRSYSRGDGGDDRGPKPGRAYAGDSAEGARPEGGRAEGARPEGGFRARRQERSGYGADRARASAGDRPPRRFEADTAPSERNFNEDEFPRQAKSSGGGTHRSDGRRAEGRPSSKDEKRERREFKRSEKRDSKKAGKKYVSKKRRD